MPLTGQKLTDDELVLLEKIVEDWGCIEPYETNYTEVSKLREKYKLK